jgi:hypothetical protein
MNKEEGDLKTVTIPENYYCEFEVELKEDIVYGVEIYRLDRY